ncbi:MAG: hypothetical protein VYC95_00190, partial [Verrucomicrobiota bacterium]|nr:hypothetical protein [Verrucomicrobiota bacterium]
MLHRLSFRPQDLSSRDVDHLSEEPHRKRPLTPSGSPTSRETPSEDDVVGAPVKLHSRSHRCLHIHIDGYVRPLSRPSGGLLMP